jgi:hypothetical protein
MIQISNITFILKLLQNFEQVSRNFLMKSNKLVSVISTLCISKTSTAVIWCIGPILREKRIFWTVIPSSLRWIYFFILDNVLMCKRTCWLSNRYQNQILLFLMLSKTKTNMIIKVCGDESSIINISPNEWQIFSSKLKRLIIFFQFWSLMKIKILICIFCPTAFFTNITSTIYHKKTPFHSYFTF